MDHTDQQRYIASVKAEWAEMWNRRLEDDERAEGIADRDYALLFVEKGLVIFATRACRPPRLEEILNKHGIEERTLRPPPTTGGWHKFAKITLNRQTIRKASAKPQAADRRGRLQLKKHGRGWLHS